MLVANRTLFSNAGLLRDLTLPLLSFTRGFSRTPDLTLTFELGLGHFVFRPSWQELGVDFDLLHGGLLPFGLVVLTLSPLIATRLGKIKKPRERS